MKQDELIPLLIVNGIFGFFSLLIGGIQTVIPTCLIISFLTLFFIRYAKYHRRAGKYKLSPFACHIFSDEGLIASFKGSDWWAVDEPIPLITKKIPIKEYNISKSEFSSNEKIVEVDFLREYQKMLDLFLKQIIPDPASNPNITVEVTLDDLVKNLKSDEIYHLYNSLDFKEKCAIASLMRKILASEIGEVNPKVYQIASLTNEVFIYWFAQGQPADYSTYSSKQFFRKWKIMPWFRGFSVVEMWGKQIKQEREVLGQPLKCLICLPIQDEKYKVEKVLNLKKYSIMSSALSTLFTTVLSALPYLGHVRIIETERDRYKEEVEVYKRGIMSIYADISSISNLFFSAMSLLSKVGGAISAMPEIPSEIKKELEELIPAMKVEESKLAKLKETLVKLTKEEEKPKEEKEKLEVKPPATASTTE